MNFENATSTPSLGSPTSPLLAFDRWSPWCVFSSGDCSRLTLGFLKLQGKVFEQTMHGIRLSLNLRTQQAHADVNGSSGSKFCKLFGFWLLKALRVGDNDDWKTYHARWEWIGWMLLLLFLSRTGYVFNVVAWSCQLTFLFYLNNSETNPLIIACPIHLHNLIRNHLCN